MIDHENRLDILWKRRDPTVDWPNLEGDIRKVLREYINSIITPKEALKLIDQYIGAHTLRGTVSLDNMI